MFKNISKLLLSPLLLLAFVLPAKADVAAGVSYLKTQTQDDWVIMALAAAGAHPDSAPLQFFCRPTAPQHTQKKFNFSVLVLKVPNTLPPTLFARAALYI